MNPIKYFMDKIKRPPTGEQPDTRASCSGTQDSANPNDFYEEFKGKGGVSEAVCTMDKYDPKLSGLMQTRKLGVLCLPREITGESPQADFIREVFGKIKRMWDFLSDVLSCIACGFAVVEKVWEERDGKFVIVNLKVWDQDRFVFEKGQLCLDDGGVKIPADPAKFAVISFQPKNGNPWGSALYHKVYWYWYLKRNSVKFWAVFTERFGAPVTVGKMGDKAYGNEQVKAVVKEFVQTISKTSAPSITVPSDVEIAFIQANQSGSLASYERFLQFLDDSIAIAVLGQTLTSNVGQSGSYSLGQVHNQIRKDILSADVMMLETFINDQIIEPLLSYNFGDIGDDVPKWRIVTDDAIDKSSLATAYKTLSDAGFDQIPLSHIHEQFGIPVPQNGEPTMKPRAMPSQFLPGDNTFTASEAIRQEQIRLYREDLKRLR